MTKTTEAEKDAAFERGWVDSLDARWSPHPGTHTGYWYNQGWQACAEYRWTDPSGRGVAPDRTFRTPRPRR